MGCGCNKKLRRLNASTPAAVQMQQNVQVPAPGDDASVKVIMSARLPEGMLAKPLGAA